MVPGDLRAATIRCLLGLCSAQAMGCADEDDVVCGGPTPDGGPVIFELDCMRSNLTIELSGACSREADGGVTVLRIERADAFFIDSGPGTCHVDLSFDSGHVFSTDLVFDLEHTSIGQGKCSRAISYAVPRTARIQASDPSVACESEGGSDAGNADAGQ